MRTGKHTQDSVLFITLDSCRYDTFVAAAAPHLKAVAPVHCAKAPSHYTYGSHSAMFVGFTPGVETLEQPLLNPKVSKLFKIVGAGFAAKSQEGYLLEGANIVEGFSRQGFTTVGTGAMGWFDTATDTGQHLTRHFDHFHYQGAPVSLRLQLDFVQEKLEQVSGDVFVFMNIGETHVPYWHEGAPWDASDNPCVPFQKENRQGDCAQRQGLCLEYVDRQLCQIIERFSGSTILVCADHGDAWGEDGLWEHGIWHEIVMTVPLLMRLRGVPVAADPTTRIVAEAPRKNVFRRLLGAS